MQHNTQPEGWQSYNYLHPSNRQVLEKFSALTAETTQQLLNEIAKDELHVYKEIIRYSAPNISNQDEARAEILYRLAEEAHKRPKKLLQTYNSYYWRFWFTSFAKNHLYRSRQYSRIWGSNRELFYQEPEELPLKEEELLEFVKNCLDLINKEFHWWERKLWAIYYYDVDDWLKEQKAPKKISYRYIADRTEISRSQIYKSVSKVDEYIRNNYEKTYGRPPLFSEN